MTNGEARALFTAVALQHRAEGRLDEAAKVELAREYFCNETFRKFFGDYVWDLNNEGESA